MRSEHRPSRASEGDPAWGKWYEGRWLERWMHTTEVFESFKLRSSGNAGVGHMGAAK